MNGTADNLNGALLVLIPALPLLAALLGYVLAARNGRRAALAAWLGGVALTLSAALSLWLLLAVQRSGDAVSWSRPWLSLPDGLAIPLSFYGAEAQLLFALTTALIGLVVLIFAVRERRGDPRSGVFFATLTLFAAAMLLFLTADTLVLIYIAWELMGLCSYLLIAHPGTAEAWRAARQAFWTTRATDFGLLFAVLLMLTLFRWTTLSEIDLNAMLAAIAQAGGDPQAAVPWLSAIVLLVLLAVIGKAAQLPLCFWLADAMVAPAPVSALLHAATMVAAGPYLLTRLHQFLLASDLALLVATLLGGLTLLSGAIMALASAEPKRILAYSTVSHLGLVIVAVAVIAEEAGFYHLLAHAWFKAALFLGVGYLVAVFVAEHAGGGKDAVEHHAPRLPDLAGCARRHPLLLWGILVPAGLSLAGLFPLAGALGKEQVLFALLTRFRADAAPGMTFEQIRPLAAAGWTVGAGMLILALPLTAAYITRLIGVLGWGRSGGGEIPGDERGRITAPTGWELPLTLTAALALIGSAGWAVVYFTWFRTPAGFAPEQLPWKWSSLDQPVGILALVLSLLLVLVGAALTWHLRVGRAELGDRLLREGGMAPLIRFFAGGMYLRELFTLVVGRFGELLAVLAGRADIGLVDWLALRCGALGRHLAVLARWLDDHVVDGARWWACELWWLLKRLHSRSMQTGQIQHYMFIVLIGTALLCLVILRPLGQILANILGRI